MNLKTVFPKDEKNWIVYSIFDRIIICKTLSIVFLLIILVNIFNTTAKAKDFSRTQEDNLGIVVGETFRFKYDILKVNGSSKNAHFDIITSIDDSQNILTIREGDIVQCIVRNIGLIGSFYYANVSITLEDSNQETIEIIVLFANLMYFSWANNETMYQRIIDYYNENARGHFESTKSFIESDRFYALVYFNQEEDYTYTDFVEIEINIPNGVVCYYEEKYVKEFTEDYSIFYDHIRIISLDHQPIYAKGVDGGFDLYKFITVELAGLVTNPFFYLILAELGVLIVLLMHLRKKGAFKKF